MLSKPTGLQDDKLREAIRAAYRVNINSLDFMSVGEASWNYRLEETPRRLWFVKVIQSKRYDPAFLVPAFLSEVLGYDFVIAPSRTVEGRLWTTSGSFTILLYPYLSGENAERRQLSANEWSRIGEIIRTLHQTSVPADLRTELWQETFVSRWAHGAREVVLHAMQRQPEGIAGELAAFIRAREREIESILSRTEALGKRLKLQPMTHVLCHADPNKSNIFTTGGLIVLLDWEDVMLAPKERDLMHFIDKEKDAFYEGYDPERRSNADSIAIAYYRFDWVVQEISSFGQRIFFSDLSDPEKLHALREFFRLFESGNVVDAAYEVDLGR